MSQYFHHLYYSNLHCCFYFNIFKCLYALIVYIYTHTYTYMYTYIFALTGFVMSKIIAPKHPLTISQYKIKCPSLSVNPHLYFKQAEKMILLKHILTLQSAFHNLHTIDVNYFPRSLQYINFTIYSPCSTNFFSLCFSMYSSLFL